MKYLAALAVTALSALVMFDEELGISKYISTLVLFSLLIIAVVFKRKIINLSENQYKQQILPPLWLLASYFTTALYAIFMKRFSTVCEISDEISSKILIGILLLPAIYSLVVNTFNDRD
jgi:drug/metabolite transporter (DMT)-like permease